MKRLSRNEITDIRPRVGKEWLVSGIVGMLEFHLPHCPSTSRLLPTLVTDSSGSDEGCVDEADAIEDDDDDLQ